MIWSLKSFSGVLESRIWGVEVLGFEFPGIAEGAELTAWGFVFRVPLNPKSRAGFPKPPSPKLQIQFAPHLPHKYGTHTYPRAHVPK